MAEFLNEIEVSPEEFKEKEKTGLPNETASLIKKTVEDSNGKQFYLIYLDNNSTYQEKKLREIVHDFNNILSNIYQSAGIMREHLENPEQLNNLLHRIRVNAERASGLVKSILKKEPESFATKNYIIDLQEILNEIIEDAKINYPAVRITGKLDKNPDKILGNKDSLFRVFNNLIANAAESLPENGAIDITAENFVSDETGTPVNLPKGRYVKVSVKDNGEGISNDKIDKIFKRGFSTKNRDKESGLGLHIVKKEVNSQNGMIEVNSKMDAGTNFIIYLKSAKTLDIKTVLISDDEKDLRELIADLFKSYNYKVIESSENKNVLDIVRKGLTLDLIIIDQKMPDFSGLECIKEIKNINSEIPVILITGSENLKEEEVKNAGADRLLVKPFTFDQLLERANELL